MMGKRRYHEASVGASSDWRTPKFVFDALKLEFDLDPCWPDAGPCFVPAKKFYRKLDDGLRQPWPRGALVWLNAPFGGRRGHVPWLQKFFRHGHGIALCSALTSSDWFHRTVWPQAELICFTRGKVKFIAADGNVGKETGFGTALIAAGDIAKEALRRSDLGACVILAPAVQQTIASPVAGDLFATQLEARP